MSNNFVRGECTWNFIAMSRQMCSGQFAEVGKVVLTMATRRASHSDSKYQKQDIIVPINSFARLNTDSVLIGLRRWIRSLGFRLRH